MCCPCCFCLKVCKGILIWMLWPFYCFVTMCSCFCSYVQELRVCVCACMDFAGILVLVYLCFVFLTACASRKGHSKDRLFSLSWNSYCSMICAVLTCMNRELAEEMEATKRADAAQEARDQSAAARYNYFTAVPLSVEVACVAICYTCLCKFDCASESGCLESIYNEFFHMPSLPWYY